LRFGLALNAEELLMIHHWSAQAARGLAIIFPTTVPLVVKTMKP
jgi:hypothetical protein